MTDQLLFLYMALSAEAAFAARPGTTAPESTPTNAPKHAENKVFAKFNLIEFRNVSSVEANKTPEAEGLKEKTKERYLTFLHGYLTKLQRLSNGGNADVVREDEQALLNEFTKYGEAGRRGEISEAQIEEFLKEPQGWAVATQMMEQYIMRLENSFGIYAAANPSGDRASVLRSGRIWLDVDRGALNKLYHDSIRPHLRRIGRWTVGALGFGGAGAAIIHVSAASTPISAGVGMAFGGMYGIYHLMRNGVTVDLRRCLSAFQLASADPREAVYIREMTGIDVNDFQPNAAQNGIELRPGRSYETARPADSYREELTDLITARQEFYTGIGVDPDDLDATPEQYLHAENGQGFAGRGRRLRDGGMVRQSEQTGAWWQEEMKTLFNPNREGIRSIDTSTRPPTLQTVEVENPPGSGRWEANPNFDPGRLDYYGNLERFMEARRQVVLRSIEEFTENRRLQETWEQDIKMFEDRKEGLAAARTEQGREDTETAGRYKKDRETLEGERGVLVKYQSGILEMGEKQEAAATAREIRTEALLTEVVNPAGVAPYTDTTTMRADLYGLLTGTVPNLIIDGVPMTNPQGRITTAQTAHDTYVNAGVVPPDNPTTFRDKVARGEANLRIVRDQVEADIKFIQEKMKQIREAENAAADVIPSLNAEDVRKAREEARRMETDYQFLRELDGLGGVELTDDMLLSVSVEDIMEQVILANTVDATRGWPESQRNDPNRRMQIVRAMAESRARERVIYNPPIYETLIASPQVTHGALRGWGITEHQLLTMTPEGIQRLVTRRSTDPAYLGVTAPTDVDEIRAAQTAAQLRLNSRIDAVIETEEFLDNQEKIRTAAAEAVTIDEQERRYNLTVAVMKRQGNEIFPRAMDIRRDNFSLISDRLIDPSNPADERRFTPAEREEYDSGGGVMLQTPAGYLNMMDMFFGYRKEANKNQALERAMEILPPARLAEILDDQLVIPFGPPRGVRTDLGAVFTDIRKRLNGEPAMLVRGRRVISERNVRQAMARIIDIIREETNAIV